MNITYERFGDIYIAVDEKKRPVGLLRKLGNGSARGKYFGRSEANLRRLQVDERITRQYEKRKRYREMKKNI